MPTLPRKTLGKTLAPLAFALAVSSPLAALAQTAPTPPPVTVAQPLQRNVTEWDEHIARLEPFARVELRPRVSGQVDKVNFRDGQLVRAGDLLFTIDRRPFEIALEAARAEVARAEAKLDLANQEIERTIPLVRNRFAPEAQLDSRRAAQRDAVAALDAARAAQRNAELELSWTEVRAPNAGRVSDRRVDAGNLVQANTTLLTTILTLDPIYARFDMSEADYLRLARQTQSGARRPDREPGNTPVQLRLVDETGFDHKGRIDFLDTALDARSGTVRARAVLPNPDLFLTPGSFARLRLWAGEAEALLVPDAAIAADQASRMVLTVTADGTVVPKQVTLGPVIDGLRLVRSGLTPEDRVIIAGLHRARPGARVTAELGRIGDAPQLAESR
ncbi:efflux RND transporter periplasmic adaptor subunit [Siccirubricoccus sp. KC 17139]|uniref:Efflux RND transporter periplasmic adaptor subunit n=1 Tax=Siccirubricoccus soli TaxID=2899147 RepID=A0ABT1DDS2_9PROT|nr:efflux RND transporter periplasmic adaptor subunit [Siccirubricoccus soli]MCO6419354.1 efflux RND transporter periplasmic adaptor subunit [Siccirubricoccus soli]MCP2685489.1 efflux RND transporter periplasmic adaptor subunit [Siccirubricoccus soli]